MKLIAVHPDYVDAFRQSMQEGLTLRGLTWADFEAEFEIVTDRYVPKTDEDGDPVVWQLEMPEPLSPLDCDFCGGSGRDPQCPGICCPKCAVSIRVGRRKSPTAPTRAAQPFSDGAASPGVAHSEPARHSPSMGDGSTGWLPNAEAEAQQQRPADK